MSALQTTWFFLIGFLLTGYAILDGFDLGVGFWHLFTRKDEDRRALLGPIAPVWDGNEVWLLTAGGAIFAAFPHVYATVFSGLYLALMLVIFALIFRAVSVEFRNHAESTRWRRGWDLAFAAGSTVPALLFGVAVGNILRGLPLDTEMRFTGDFLTLLNPYALLIGLVGLAMFATHGAVYLALKTGGDLSTRAARWARISWVVFVALLLLTDLVTLTTQPRLVENYLATPALWAIPVFALLVAVMTGVFLRRGRPGKAFVASSLTVASLMGMCGASLFPTLVPALGDPALSLTITNASSSPLTLTVMLILAAVGMPLVIGYTIWVYRIFAGKVMPQHEGY